MNLQQVQFDLDNGIMLSRITVRKLVEAGLMMQSALKAVDNTHHAAACMVTLDTVEDM